MLKYNGHTFTDNARCACCVADKKVLVVDPTGTQKIRTMMRSDFNKRWMVVKQAAREMIDKQDILGLKGSSAMQIVAPGVVLSGTRQEMFARWFDITVSRAIVGDGMWQGAYLKTAFNKGTTFGQAQAHTTLVSKNSAHRFDGIVALARAETQGIMDAVKQQATRIVALGIATNEKPMTIVRGVWAAIEKTGMVRSNAMLNLMVVKAFGDATLDVYEAAGINKVGLIPESVGARNAQAQQTATIGTKDAARKGPGSRSRTATPSKSTINRIKRAERNVHRALGESVNVRTAGDDDVCPVCEAISENGPYSINRARQLIPAHPHCRCAFVPADDQRFATDTRARGELIAA